MNSSAEVMTTMRLRIPRVSPATWLALVALPAAPASAAVLARNSVGTPQLGDDAVISSKVKHGTLKRWDLPPEDWPTLSAAPGTRDAGARSAPRWTYGRHT